MDFFNLKEYTMEDIQYLIDFGIEESIHLDYKASGALDKSETKKKEISKDVSAGAVLVFAVFAVLCGVSILFQPEAFEALFNHYVQAPINILWFVLSVVVATLFIFKFDAKKKEN